MPAGICGNYEIIASFGTNSKQPFNLDVNMIEELTIIQDINKFLPTIRMRIADPTGTLSYVAPFDSSTNTLTIKVSSPVDTAQNNGQDNTNEFVFKIYRKAPVQVTGGSGIYDVVGALAVNNFFAPSYVRSSTQGQTIRQFIGVMILDMLNGTDIGVSSDTTSTVSKTLDYPGIVYQPNWTNAELIEDLKKRLRVDNGDSDFRIFISMLKGTAQVNVRTWNELCNQPIKAIFVIGENPIVSGDNVINAVISHMNYDNYMLMGATGIKQQDYNYFDYETSSFVDASVNLDDMTSITKYHLIDGNDSIESDSAFYGRTHDFTEDFSERAISTLYSKATNLVKMWADTDGGNMHNLQPGSLVQVMFGLNAGSRPEEYQHSGFWLIEKVIHMVGKTFFTRMLLTRTGLDTTNKTTLMKAKMVRMNPYGVKIQ